MKWIRDRDALIAQTMAFVQSVTGKTDRPLPPVVPTAGLDVRSASDGVEAAVVESPKVETPAVALEPMSLPAPSAPTAVFPPRAGTDVRSEIQARIASFRKHQERFEREREEYCAATLAKLRTAPKAPRRPPAET